MGVLLSCMSFVEVIKLVHINGHVEEMSKPVKVEDVMRANPQYFVGRASYRQTAVLPPDASLELGQIYFLLPSNTMMPSGIPTSAPMSPRLTMPLPHAPLRLLSPKIPCSNTDTIHDVKSIMEGGLGAPPTFTLRQGERFGVAKVLMSKRSFSDYLEEWDEMKLTNHNQMYGKASIGYGRVFAAAEIENMHHVDDDMKAWSPSLASIPEES